MTKLPRRLSAACLLCAIGAASAAGALADEPSLDLRMSYNLSLQAINEGESKLGLLSETVLHSSVQALNFQILPWAAKMARQAWDRIPSGSIDEDAGKDLLGRAQAALYPPLSVLDGALKKQFQKLTAGSEREGRGISISDAQNRFNQIMR